MSRQPTLVPGDHVTRDGQPAKVVQVVDHTAVLIQYVPGGFSIVPRAALTLGWPGEQHEQPPRRVFVLKTPAITGAWVPLAGRHVVYTADEALQSALEAVQADPTLTIRIYDLRATDDAWASEITGVTLDTLRPETDA